MEVIRIRALRGPNLWTRHTAVEALCTRTTGEALLSELPGFEVRLRARFPEIGPLQPRGASSPPSLASALACCALSLQAQAGCPVTFWRAIPTITRAQYQVVVEYTEEAVGRRALLCALDLCLSALEDTPFDIVACLSALRAIDEDVRLGPSTGAIVEAAVARGIPWRRLTEGSLIQFGWGSRQRRIQAAELDSTSAIAESIAQDKELTKQLLEAAGVPTPRGRVVDSLEDARAAFQALGVPAVVKPRDSNQGKGVTVNITTTEGLEQAYGAAAAISEDVIVERYLPGHDFRLLVVGDRLVAAARRDPPHVIGDGQHTVRELVDRVNADPRRGDGHATSLTRIRLDDIALARLEAQGLDADSVPARGARVILRNNANLSTGGTATDVTDEVHPALAASAVTATRMVGLDICGVDVVCDSVLRPLEEQGGGVVEVNAAPGLRMHLQPSFGKGRPVGDAIVAELFAPGQDGRIPVVAVTGTNGKTTTVRLVAHLLARAGLRVGVTSTDSVRVDGTLIDTGDCSGPRSARKVLAHPDVDAAVLETARGGILREGLAFDRCQVAVVTNVGNGDHLGLNFITTVDDLTVLKRVIVQNVAADGMAVLNADDSRVVGMADDCPGRVTFFSLDASTPLIAAHRARGQRVVYRDGGDIVATQGASTRRIPLEHVPFTLGGCVPFQVANALAAVGAAWALDLDWDVIRDGLATFASDAAANAGRFNVTTWRGATVIADYGHNPDAMTALCAAVEAMPARRRLVVISGAGDRRDQDIREQTAILGEVFDEVILYEDQCQRGRADGEVVALLREGLAGAPRARLVAEIRGEFRAIDTALARLQTGDLCLILVDQVEAALAHLESRLAEA